MKYVPLVLALLITCVFVAALIFLSNLSVKIVIDACDPSKPQIICQQVTRS